jgi:aryl-alcohol dehydrogenase-like predicted oxidoreductase
MQLTGPGIWGEPRDADEAIRVLRRAVELGITFIDTADSYGPEVSERLIGEALHPYADDVVIATKAGLLRTGPDAWVPLGNPSYLRQEVELSLRQLGVDRIDLHQLHRIDPNFPLEDQVGELGKLQQEGKIRHIGLSEAGVDNIRRAHAVHPITALQSEYSLWTRDPEPDVLPLLRELGIGFVAYSPLGRGFLTGQIKSTADFDDSDNRKTNPRFEGENFEQNLRAVAEVEAIAADVGATPAQVALAWLLAQGDHIAPIPGTKRVSRLEENIAADDVELTAEQLQKLTDVSPAAGEHHNEQQMKWIDR